MTDVALAGIGIHPFGRHEGVSALAMGAFAVRAALADAGAAWREVQFAYGGSEDGGNADTMVSELGPTGLPFVNVKNGCATGGSSLVSAVTAIRSGEYDVGVVVGFDKHPRGAFQIRRTGRSRSGTARTA
jgi:acetyl-CoA acetyltransferase